MKGNRIAGNGVLYTVRSLTTSLQLSIEFLVIVKWLADYSKEMFKKVVGKCWRGENLVYFSAFLFFFAFY